MDYKITGYEPAQLFHFFEEVSAIPRGSGNEKGISDFLVAFAKERGLDVYQDEVYNVIIRKPASAGAENAPTVMLQGHIDMVCDKLGSVEHDFTTDGIDLVVKDGVLTANGTTLGADNGIAVALMLTVLNDDSIAHPALECVFTTDEETGLVGAETLDKSQISARTMINLDSEEEGVATVSCAGGVVVTYTCPIAREHKTGSTLTLDISGLLGGHSGSDIHLERGNGNLIMARIIDRLMVAGEPAIVSFNGGTKDNAIPRSCQATLVAPSTVSARLFWSTPTTLPPRPRPRSPVASSPTSLPSSRSSTPALPALSRLPTTPRSRPWTRSPRLPSSAPCVLPLTA